MEYGITGHTAAPVGHVQMAAAMPAEGACAPEMMEATRVRMEQARKRAAWSLILRKDAPLSGRPPHAVRNAGGRRRSAENQHKHSDAKCDIMFKMYRQSRRDNVENIYCSRIMLQCHHS